MLLPLGGVVPSPNQILDPLLHIAAVEVTRAMHVAHLMHRKNRVPVAQEGPGARVAERSGYLCTEVGEDHPAERDGRQSRHLDHLHPSQRHLCCDTNLGRFFLGGGRDLFSCLLTQVWVCRIYSVPNRT